VETLPSLEEGIDTKREVLALSSVWEEMGKSTLFPTLERDEFASIHPRGERGIEHFSKRETGKRRGALPLTFYPSRGEEGEDWGFLYPNY